MDNVQGAVLVICLAALEILSVQAAEKRTKEYESAIKENATKGVATFIVNGREMTMFNGLNSKNGDKGCTVNLAFNETGEIVTDWTGLIGEWTNPARFPISDCSKLPKKAFLTNTNE